MIGQRCQGCWIVVMGLSAVVGLAPAEEKPAQTTPARSPDQAVELFAAAAKAGDVLGALYHVAQPFHDIVMWNLITEDTDDVLRSALDEKFGKELRRGFRMEVRQEVLRLQRIEILDKNAKSDVRVKINVRETTTSFHDNRTLFLDTHYIAVKEGNAWKLLRPFHVIRFGAASQQKRVAKKAADGKDIEVLEETFAKMEEVVEKGASGKEFKARRPSRTQTVDMDDVGDEMRRDKGRNPSTELTKWRRYKLAADQIAADVKAGKFQTRQEAMKAFDAAKAKADQQAKP